MEAETLFIVGSRLEARSGIAKAIKKIEADSRTAYEMKTKRLASYQKTLSELLKAFIVYLS